MKILIAGGTGLIGSHLTASFMQDGHDVTVLSRQIRKSDNEKGLHYITWDGTQIPEMPGVAFDVLVNLSGVPIGDTTWTKKYKKEILDSRLLSTRAFVRFIQEQKQKPILFINASAVGYYGHRPEEVLVEKSERGDGFLADVVHQWEAAADEAGTRTVFLRNGLVLAKNGGVMEKLLIPFRFFTKVVFGSGKQHLPWVHIEDVVGVVKFVMEREQIQGAVNVVAPDMITNNALLSEIAHYKNAVLKIPLPFFLLKGLLGERIQLFSADQEVMPLVLQDEGYQYCFPNISMAIKDILNND